MVWLHPKSVTLLGEELTGVRAVTVSASAKNVLEEWTDGGPYAAFVDATGVSVEIVIERDAVEDSAGLVGGPVPGELGTLTLAAAPSGASAHVEDLTATVVVTSVKHTLHGGSGPTQRIACRAVSSDGIVAPVTLAGGK